MNRLLGGTALTVDGHAGHRFRQPRAEHGGARDIEGLRPDLADAAVDHVVHAVRRDAGALQYRINDFAAQIRRVDPAEPAVAAAAGGAYRFYYVCRGHDEFLA